MSKSNMYDWIGRTANPLSGECSHKCSYCYVTAIKKRNLVAINKKYSGTPRISENGIKQLRGKNKQIFVSSMTDLFAENVEHDDILDILGRCQRYNNKYLFQTKNPGRIIKTFLKAGFNEYNLLGFIPKNSIISTTVESNIRYKEMGNSPELIDRIRAIKSIGFNFETQITIEPIMDFNLDFFVEMLKDANVSQINIGADSGNNNLQEPKREKILKLISELEKFTTVKQKSNLKRLLI